MLPDRADEGELLVNWPRGTPGSGTGTGTLQDDLDLRLDRDSKRAADTLDRLRAYQKSLDYPVTDMTGVRGNVTYEWTVNEYHHPSQAMHRLFDRCVPSA